MDTKVHKLGPKSDCIGEFDWCPGRNAKIHKSIGRELSKTSDVEVEILRPIALDGDLVLPLLEWIVDQPRNVDKVLVVPLGNGKQRLVPLTYTFVTKLGVADFIKMNRRTFSVSG